MASGLTTAERNRYLTANYKTATVYGAYCITDPSDGGVMSGKEASGNAYARTEIVFGNDAVAGSISNTAACEFPAANGGAHGLIAYLVICTTNVEDADTGIVSGAMDATKQIDDADQLVFIIGAITVAIAEQV